MDKEKDRFRTFRRIVIGLLVVLFLALLVFILMFLIPAIRQMHGL